MSPRLRLAFLKPHHGVTGGFEAVTERLAAIARADGHRVEHLAIDMVAPRAAVAGLDIPRNIWDRAPEYFTYLAGRDGFSRLETQHFDAVISTQPPSFAVDHPHHLSVFYHHHRVYYDLEETYLRAGFAPDPAVHREAGEIIRRLDQPTLDSVSWFLAGSATVADRLATFNDARNTSVLHAGLVVGEPCTSGDADRATGAVLSVGRHEFPKRTELVVAAAHLLSDTAVTLVGTGGRLAWAKALDHSLATGDRDPAALTDAELWCNTGQGAPTVPAGQPSNVRFAGRVTNDELAQLYREAPCVVAPALDEDYGLTAIEAMAQAKPVIVCRDGGGLTELVSHEQTGLVVEPTPTAIAAAIDRLTSDVDLAAELGANGRQRAAELSWENTAAEFRDGLERVLA